MKKINLFKSILIFTLIFLSFNYSFAQNNALNFDGTNDKVDISNSPSLNFSINDKFSIEAWFNTTASGYKILVSNRIDTPPYTGYEFMLNSGTLDFSIISTILANSMKIVTTNTFNDGNWHHAVAVYRGIPNGNNTDIYVDGILQAKTIPNNSLSGIITNTNLVTIAARQGVSAYNFNGSIDEVRIWNKALCIQEIVAKKNCHLLGSEYGLVAYYNFNQGIPAGNNATVTILPDLTISNNTGTLTSFALTGATSNWITSGAPVTGTCVPFGLLAVSGNTALCTGQTFSTVLTASGATTYSWSTGPNTSTISVSPTITTNYSVLATDVNTCTTKQTVTVSVNPLPAVTAVSNQSLLCSGQSSTLTSNGANTYTWSTSSNSTSIVISPTITSTYTVSGTSSVGCTNSVAITQSVIICTGLNELSSYNKTNVIAYPNPSNGNIIVTSDHDISLKLINELGMLIEIINLNQDNNMSVKINALNSGLYLLISNDNKLKQKLI
ncbi:MAG: LamG-like jellyroll fold domain-containing protein [Bacteroidota bacterium]